MFLTVWSVKPADETSPGNKARLAGVAAIALAAHVDTHLPAAPWPALSAAAEAAGASERPASAVAAAVAVPASKTVNRIRCGCDFGGDHLLVGGGRIHTRGASAVTAAHQRYTSVRTVTRSAATGPAPTADL